MEKLEKLLFDYDGTTELYRLDSLDFLHGFIKWLVENDKIEEGNFFYNTGDLPDDEVSKLLMLLSIQDEPIDFLISILK